MKETMEEMATKYQAELDTYKLRFFTQWGYKPIDPASQDFRFLSDKKKRMCLAFWNHKDITKCISLTETLFLMSETCKLMRVQK